MLSDCFDLVVLVLAACASVWTSFLLVSGVNVSSGDHVRFTERWSDDLCLVWMCPQVTTYASQNVGLVTCACTLCECGVNVSPSDHVRFTERWSSMNVSPSDHVRFTERWSGDLGLVWMCPQVTTCASRTLVWWLVSGLNVSPGDHMRFTERWSGDTGLVWMWPRALQETLVWQLVFGPGMNVSRGDRVLFTGQCNLRADHPLLLVESSFERLGRWSVVKWVRQPPQIQLHLWLPGLFLCGQLHFQSHITVRWPCQLTIISPPVQGLPFCLVYVHVWFRSFLGVAREVTMASV